MKAIDKSLLTQKLVLTKRWETWIAEQPSGVDPKDTTSAHIRKPAAILCFLQWFSPSFSPFCSFSKLCSVPYLLLKSHVVFTLVVLDGFCVQMQ